MVWRLCRYGGSRVWGRRRPLRSDRRRHSSAPGDDGPAASVFDLRMAIAQHGALYSELRKSGSSHKAAFQEAWDAVAEEWQRSDSDFVKSRFAAAYSDLTAGGLQHRRAMTEAWACVATEWRRLTRPSRAAPKPRGWDWRQLVKAKFPVLYEQHRSEGLRRKEAFRRAWIEVAKLWREASISRRQLLANAARSGHRAIARHCFGVAYRELRAAGADHKAAYRRAWVRVGRLWRSKRASSARKHAPRAGAASKRTKTHRDFIKLHFAPVYAKLRQSGACHHDAFKQTWAELAERWSERRRRKVLKAQDTGKVAREQILRSGRTFGRWRAHRLFVQRHLADDLKEELPFYPNRRAAFFDVTGRLNRRWSGMTSSEQAPYKAESLLRATQRPSSYASFVQTHFRSAYKEAQSTGLCPKDAWKVAHAAVHRKWQERDTR